MWSILKRTFGMLALLVAAVLLIGGGGCVLLTLPAVMRGEVAITLIGLFVIALGLSAWRLGLRAWRRPSNEPAPPAPHQP